MNVPSDARWICRECNQDVGTPGCEHIPNGVMTHESAKYFALRIPASKPSRNRVITLTGEA